MLLHMEKSWNKQNHWFLQKDKYLMIKDNYVQMLFRLSKESYRNRILQWKLFESILG